MRWQSIKPHNRVFLVALAALSSIYLVIVLSILHFFDSFVISRTAEGYVLATRALAKTINTELGRGNYRVAYGMLHAAKSELKIEKFVVVIDGNIVFSSPEITHTIELPQYFENSIKDESFGSSFSIRLRDSLLVVQEPLMGSRSRSILLVFYDLSRMQVIKSFAIGWISLSSFLGMIVIGTVFVFLQRRIKKIFESFNNSVIAIVGDQNFEIPKEISVHHYDSIAALHQFKSRLLQLQEKVIEDSKAAAAARVYQNITHDMRAPIGTFERLLFTKDEEIPRMMPAIKESVNRLYTMIEALRHGEVDNIIKKSWASLDFNFGYESLLGKAHTYKVSLKVPVVGFDNIHVDKDKLERAWINLASNAIEFAKTEVTIEAESKGEELIIRILDDGPGVPDDFLPKLFQRGATHGKHDGTGLGLAYVKQVIMGHGGDVRYYREDNLTVFECLIPHAFESKLRPPIEKAHVDQEIKEPLRKNIGIVFRSPSLSSEILDRLNAIKTETMLWHGGFDQSYDFIITDDPNIVDKCIDEGISVAQFKPDTPASEIVRRALIRLGIPQIERTEDV